MENEVKQEAVVKALPISTDYTKFTQVLPYANYDTQTFSIKVIASVIKEALNALSCNSSTSEQYQDALFQVMSPNEIMVALESPVGSIQTAFAASMEGFVSPVQFQVKYSELSRILGVVGDAELVTLTCDFKTLELNIKSLNTEVTILLSDTVKSNYFWTKETTYLSTVSTEPFNSALDYFNNLVDATEDCRFFFGRGSAVGGSGSIFGQYTNPKLFDTITAPDWKFGLSVAALKVVKPFIKSGRNINVAVYLSDYTMRLFDGSVMLTLTTIDTSDEEMYTSLCNTFNTASTNLAINNIDMFKNSINKLKVVDNDLTLPISFKWQDPELVTYSNSIINKALVSRVSQVNYTSATPVNVDFTLTYSSILKILSFYAVPTNMGLFYDDGELKVVQFSNIATDLSQEVFKTYVCPRV